MLVIVTSSRGTTKQTIKIKGRQDMKNIFTAIKNMMKEYNDQKKAYIDNMACVCQPGRLANITSY